MQPRVLVAGLFHETHTFLDDTTGLSQFSASQGNELFAKAGDGSPMAGVLDTAARLSWQVIPTVDYRAQPSGTVQQEVFDQFWTQLKAGIVAGAGQGIDALCLVLHGAMVTTEIRDVEGELLSRLRALPGLGSIPIFGVFDLHANFSPAMATGSNALFAYRENPHSDGYAMGCFAAERLDESLKSGRLARTFWRHAGIIWPPTGTGTGETPMRELESLAREMEQAHADVLGVNVIGGFAFADTADTGVSFSIVTQGSQSAAERMLDQLCQRAWDLRHVGDRRDPPLAEVIEELKCQPAGLTVVAEPSDNIGGGAPGDGTGLLRALIEHGIPRSAVCICDPAAVDALRGLTSGQRQVVSLGGKGSRLDPGPLTLEVELVSHGSGRFPLEDPQSHLASMYGNAFDMGPTAVVKHGGVTILLTTVKTPPFDLGQWRSQGIEPTDYAVIGVKAAVAHRRAYDPIAARMRWVDTPGPCRSDLTRLPYRHVNKSRFPLDRT